MHFKVTARATRGGWRGYAVAGNGVVMMKTVPVFREKKDAESAMRAWLSKRGAHADRRISRGECAVAIVDGGQMEILTHAPEATARKMAARLGPSMRRLGYRVVVIPAARASRSTHGDRVVRGGKQTRVEQFARLRRFLEKRVGKVEAEREIRRLQSKAWAR